MHKDFEADLAKRCTKANDQQCNNNPRNQVSFSCSKLPCHLDSDIAQVDLVSLSLPHFMLQPFSLLNEPTFEDAFTKYTTKIKVICSDFHHCQFPWLAVTASFANLLGASRLHAYLHLETSEGIQLSNYQSESLVSPAKEMGSNQGVWLNKVCLQLNCVLCTAPWAPNPSWTYSKLVGKCSVPAEGG